jgi:hypothetical protein
LGFSSTVFGEQPREFWSQGVRVWIEFSRVKRSGKVPSRKRWKSKPIYRQRTLKNKFKWTAKDVETLYSNFPPVGEKLRSWPFVWKWRGEQVQFPANKRETPIQTNKTSHQFLCWEINIKKERPSIDTSVLTQLLMTAAFSGSQCSTHYFDTESSKALPSITKSLRNWHSTWKKLFWAQVINNLFLWTMVPQLLRRSKCPPMIERLTPKKWCATELLIK